MVETALTSHKSYYENRNDVRDVMCNVISLLSKKCYMVNLASNTQFSCLDSMYELLRYDVNCVLNVCIIFSISCIEKLGFTIAITISTTYFDVMIQTK